MLQSQVAREDKISQKNKSNTVNNVDITEGINNIGNRSQLKIRILKLEDYVNPKPDIRIGV